MNEKLPLSAAIAFRQYAAFELSNELKSKKIEEEKIIRKEKKKSKLSSMFSWNNKSKNKKENHPNNENKIHYDEEDDGDKLILEIKNQIELATAGEIGN
jgi:hypothetical protein